MGGSPQTNGRLQGYIPGIMKWQFFWVGAEKARLFIGRTARAAAVLHEAACQEEVSRVLRVRLVNHRGKGSPLFITRRSRC